MGILKRLQEHSRNIPEQPAIVSETEQLNYRQLEEYSNALASYLTASYGKSKKPIVVYGHKNVFMIVCFLACVKAGRGYCPIDVSVPAERAAAIINEARPPVVLMPENAKFMAGESEPINLSQIQAICREGDAGPDADAWVKDGDTFYIIFTSGSSGTPKGVKISLGCLNHFLDWAVELGIPSKEKRGSTFLNQAPFSFDLSVMDLYTCLACGGTLWVMTKEVQGDYQKMFRLMEDSDVKVWVSTPSFADVCLADQKFAQKLLPSLRAFLFCGETLTNRTALQLQERFPKAVIVNTYGPTESTVALTEVKVDRELAVNENPLPVGRVKRGSAIEIWDEQGKAMPDGESGEIILMGDTVSTGYHQREELSRKSFFMCRRNDEVLRGYHTGDSGYLKNGMLYYLGRLDRQIKLHGYRIELDDIEQNLLRLDRVKSAVVTANERDEKITGLTAHIVYDRKVEDGRQEARRMKEELKEFLPEYMIPKRIRFLDSIPMTANGKVDRKMLQGAVR